MAGWMPRDRRDNLTLDLLEWQPPKVAVEIEQGVAGCGDLANQIARTISHALRETELDRDEVADKMSAYLGRKISRDILDKWSSEASENNRIQFDAFIALIDATGATDLLGFAPEKFGFSVVSNHYRKVIEYHEIEEHEREVALHNDQNRVRKAKLRRELGWG